MPEVQSKQLPEEVRVALEAVKIRLLESYQGKTSGNLEIHISDGKPRSVRRIFTDTLH